MIMVIDDNDNVNNNNNNNNTDDDDNYLSISNFFLLSSLSMLRLSRYCCLFVLMDDFTIVVIGNRTF